MPDAFGTIPAPGVTVVAELKPGDILASYSPPPLIKGGTIKTTQTSPGSATGTVAAGQVVDYEQATGKYIISGGTTAVGILLQSVDTSKGDVLGNIIMRGTVKRDKAIGLVAGTVTALGGRYIDRSKDASNAGDYFAF